MLMFSEREKNGPGIFKPCSEQQTLEIVSEIAGM